MHRTLALAILAACGAPAPPPPVAPTNRAAAPLPTDTDDDMITDDHDRCPDRAEDYDAFADDDGCPDPDNDGDGVGDATDDCPYEAGPVPNTGCAVACVVFVSSSDDCWPDPTVFYDEHDGPQQARLDEIVRLVTANPTVRGLEVLGPRAELVTGQLRERLPGIDLVEDRRDVGIERAILVRITRQRFSEGRFRTMECTPFGPIYRPARQDNCTR